MSDPGSTKLMSILKKRTEDVDIKKYFLQCLHQVRVLIATEYALLQHLNSIQVSKFCVHEGKFWN